MPWTALPRLLAAITLALALVVVVGSAPVMRSRAQTSIAPQAAIDVALEAPRGPIHVGDALEIVAHVNLREGARGPWMLSPTSDGPALEVVRGRLLSIDADTLEHTDRELEARLRIPVLARAQGTTVLRARVEAYGCREGRCRTIDGEGSLVVEVLPAPITP